MLIAGNLHIWALAVMAAVLLVGLRTMLQWPWRSVALALCTMVVTFVCREQIGALLLQAIVIIRGLF